MHCFYFGQILQTVWPHPVIEGTGKWCWLCSFLKPMVLSLSFNLTQVQNITTFKRNHLPLWERSIYGTGYILYFNKDWSKVLKLSYILYMSFNKDVYACLQRVFQNTEKTAMLQTSLEMWLIIMGCCSCQLKNWSLVMLSLFPSNVIKGIPSNQDRQLEMLNFKNINLFILTSHIKPSP